MKVPIAVMRSKWTFSGALLVIGMATALAAMRSRLGHSLTMDEPFMASMLQKPWSDLWKVFPIDNIPLFYVVLKGWSAIWGDSEFALRSLSALGYGAAAIVTGVGARQLSGSAAGIAAAIMIGASAQVGLESAATARPYALLAFISSIAFWLSLRAVKHLPESASPSNRFILPLTVVHLAGCFTHATYVVVAIACAGASLFSPRAARSAALPAPVLAVIAYFVLWGEVVRKTLGLGTTDWMRPPTVMDVQYVLTLVWGAGPLFILTGGLLVTLISGRKRLLVWSERVEVRWAVAMVIVAWAGVIAGSYVKPIFWVRTPMMLLPATCALSGALLAQGASRAAPLVLAAVMAVPAMARIAALQPEDPYPSRESLSILLGRAGCGDAVIAPGLSWHTAAYYFRQLGAPNCIELMPFPADQELMFGDWSRRYQDPAIVRGLEEQAERIAQAVSGRNVWLLRLTDWETREATGLIERALSNQMTCSGPEPLRGAFFTDILLCRPQRDGIAATARSTVPREPQERS